MEHDVSTMVYQLQNIMTTYIKEWLPIPNVKNIEYFSDGCAGQYKNKSNFFNLCKHEVDFGLKANWTFFATSHGKSPCDGIGGTVKRITAKVSLQRPLNDQILDCGKMFEFCENGIHFPNIKFFFVSAEQMKDLRSWLKKERFDGLTSIPGTRSYHQFQLLNDFKLGTKRSSEQENFSYIYSFSNDITKFNGNPSDTIKPSSYVACVVTCKMPI